MTHQSSGFMKELDLWTEAKVIMPLENEVKVPVVSSTPHGLMNAVRLLGTVSPRAQGFGMVLAKA